MTKRFRISSLMTIFLIGGLQAQTSYDSLRFIHITDLHLCNLQGYDTTFVKMRQHYGRSQDNVRAFFAKKPLELNAQAVIMTGDIVDYYAAETMTGEMRATQIEQFYPLLEECPVDYFLTLGNHDIASYWIDDSLKSMSSQIEAKKARADFIRNVPCFRNGTFYNREYRLQSVTYNLVFLDNGYYLPDETFIDTEQTRWLENLVAQHPDHIFLIFMHRYLPLADLNQDSVFFSSSAPDRWPENKDCTKGLLSVLDRFTHIKALIVGHGHKNVIETFELPAGHSITQIETGSIARVADNWRLLRLMPTKIAVSYPGKSETEWEHIHSHNRSNLKMAR